MLAFRSSGLPGLQLVDLNSIIPMNSTEQPDAVAARTSPKPSNHELYVFATRLCEEGMSREQVFDALAKAGGEQKQIASVLSIIDGERGRMLEEEAERADAPKQILFGIAMIAGGIIAAVVMWNLGWIVGFTIVLVISGFARLMRGISNMSS